MCIASPHIESVERYLLRIAPSLASEWQGASEEEIARIQALTPHPIGRKIAGVEMAKSRGSGI